MGLKDHVDLFMIDQIGHIKHLTEVFFEESIIYNPYNSLLRFEYIFFLMEIEKNKYKAFE